MIANRQIQKSTKVKTLSDEGIENEKYHALNALLNIGVHFLEPKIGDYVSADYYIGSHNLSWHVTQVVDKAGNRYKLYYDDEWYVFKEFSYPIVSKVSNKLIYAVLR